MRRIIGIGLLAIAIAAPAIAADAAATIVKPPHGLKWVGRVIKKDFKKSLGHDNYVMAMCVANRESHFHPKAYNPNSGASGVFQFIPSTWAWASQQAGYGGKSPFNAWANVGTAAWVVKNDGWAPWGNHCP